MSKARQRALEIARRQQRRGLAERLAQAEVNRRLRQEIAQRQKGERHE